MLSGFVKCSEIIVLLITISSATFPDVGALNTSTFLIYFCVRWMWWTTIRKSTASRFDIQTCHVLSWAKSATAIPWSLSPSWEAGWSLSLKGGTKNGVGSSRSTTNHDWNHERRHRPKPLLVIVILCYTLLLHLNYPASLSQFWLIPKFPWNGKLFVACSTSSTSNGIPPRFSASELNVQVAK